ncbi:MAG TPA: MauE/DoxX family redox-associated membrane protein [Acidimicrobiales bacterium]|nr:MauE/DoxX family redox-associated membrane protein [Acidimicrobiales bacterium]
MTGIVAGPYALACALLVVAGVSKARTRNRPQQTLGLFEIALGAAAFFAHELAPVVGLLYAGFVVYTLRAMARQKACGCFGGDERPPTPGHVALDAALALSALLAVAGDTAPAAYAGFTYAVLLGTATYLGAAVMA